MASILDKDALSDFPYQYYFMYTATDLLCHIILRVPNRFFGIRDLAYFKAGIRDFEQKGGRDSGL